MDPTLKELGPMKRTEWRKGESIDFFDYFVFFYSSGRSWSRKMNRRLQRWLNETKCFLFFLRTVFFFLLFSLLSNATKGEKKEHRSLTGCESPKRNPIGISDETRVRFFIIIIINFYFDAFVTYTTSQMEIGFCWNRIRCWCFVPTPDVKWVPDAISRERERERERTKRNKETEKKRRPRRTGQPVGCSRRGISIYANEIC